MISRAAPGLLVLLTVWFAPSVHAEPLVRVRAESRIELGVAHLELGMAVSGALRDELGIPLLHRPLALEARALEDNGEPWHVMVETDENGRFSLDLADADRDYRLLATFAGDATHRGVRVERKVERARADVRLELRLPQGNAIDLDASTFTVQSVAESDAGGDGITMRLLDEAGREIARGVTNDQGKLSLQVATKQLGPPGAGLVRIESLRDSRRAEAQTEARIVRRRIVHVALRANQATFEAGNPIDVTGEVRTGGGPRAGVPVGLFAKTQHLETVVTDAQGRFQAELWIDSRPGPLAITARTEGDATGAYAVSEAHLVLQIGPARPLPWAWISAAFATSVLVLAVVARLRRRRLVGEGAPLNGDPASGASIRPARAQGRRDRHRVHGRALDARNDAAVVGAKVAVIHDKAESCCVLATDRFGRFASPVLLNGRARIRIEASGYVATETEIEIPHRGEWSAFIVRLDSLRARALLPYRRLALRVLPSARAWGIWTTREAKEWLSERSPNEREALSALTVEVERACYASQPPSEAEVDAIEQSVEALQTRISAAAQDGPSQA